MVNPVTVRNGRPRLLRSLTTPGGHRRFLIRDVRKFARSRGSTPAPRNSGRPDRVLIVMMICNSVCLLRDDQRHATEIAIEIARDGFEAV